MSAKHSPLPWRIQSDSDGDIIEDAEGTSIIGAFDETMDANGNRFFPPCDANAQIIVERVNGYETLAAENARLRAALERISELSHSSYARFCHETEHNIEADVLVIGIEAREALAEAGSEAGE